VDAPLLYSRRLFIFDLDGTLIDSREDLSRAVNLALSRLHLPPLDTEQVIGFVGDGVDNLMRRALAQAGGHVADEPLVRRGVSLLLEEYGRHLLDATRVYPGVVEALDALWWARFAVVSNKPEHLSRRILQELGLAGRFCAILGGDSLPQRKPDPAPLRRVMEICGAAPGETVMVGDGTTDILAGKAAGVLTCGVGGGYRPPEVLLAAGCDLLIRAVAELPRHFAPPVSQPG
jgi:phosphoglycolate phosphatase